MLSAFEKRVPDEFGLVIPENNNIHWIKQGGGFSCTQHKLEGVYIPIGKIKHNLGYPDWSPEGPEFEEKLRQTDLSELNPEEKDKIPEDVLDRGRFESSDGYLNWIEESEYYGWITLWDDLRRFTYGVFENLDSDPRNRWESKDKLWDAIDDSLGFEYKEVDYAEYSSYYIEDYPRPQVVIQPIVITDGQDKGKYQTDWSSLEGEVSFLLCPNAD